MNGKNDDLSYATITGHVELSITQANIERTHRIGNPRDSGQKSRAIIVKFVRYNDRKNVLNRKKTIRKEYCSYGEFNSHSNKTVKKGQGNLQF